MKTNKHTHTHTLIHTLSIHSKETFFNLKLKEHKLINLISKKKFIHKKSFAKKHELISWFFFRAHMNEKKDAINVIH
jgi:hypothetical protein